MDSAFLEGVKKVFRIGEEQKELVDPYFVFGFAGKEVRLRVVVFSILKNNSLFFTAPFLNILL